jgi:uncharacterized membrane protein
VNPFSLPVHPIVVHFPMAMLSAAWVSLVIRYLTGRIRFGEWSRIFEAIGVATLPVAVATALIDTRGLSFAINPRWDAPLIWHAIGGLVAGGVFTVHYVWRRRAAAGEGGSAVLDVGLPTIGLWLLVLTGLIAGEMIYAR